MNLNDATELERRKANKAAKKVACVRRYNRAKQRELTDDAKAFIYHWRRLLPFVMYAKYMMVTVPLQVYDNLQCILLERVRGPVPDVLFTLVRCDKLDLEKMDFKPDRRKNRHGVIYSINQKNRGIIARALSFDRIVNIVQWTLSISPFHPIQITTVLYSDVRGVCFDGSIVPLLHSQTNLPGDWILYVQAFHCKNECGVGFYELSRGARAFHFYDERVAHEWAATFLPEVD